MGLCRATLPRGDSYHRTLRCSHSYLTLTVYEEVQYESAHDVILSGGRPVQYSWATGSADCWRHTSATRFRHRSLPCVTVCMWCWSSQQHAVDVWRTQTYTDTDRLRTLRSCSHYARKRARVSLVIELTENNDGVHTTRVSESAAPKSVWTAAASERFQWDDIRCVLLRSTVRSCELDPLRIHFCETVDVILPFISLSVVVYYPIIR